MKDKANSAMLKQPNFSTEQLEPRLLLSADFSSEAALAMSGGLDQFGNREHSFSVFRSGPYPSRITHDYGTLRL